MFKIEKATQNVRSLFFRYTKDREFKVIALGEEARGSSKGFLQP